jgi:hypothetical protein
MEMLPGQRYKTGIGGDGIGDATWRMSGVAAIGFAAIGDAIGLAATGVAILGDDWSEHQPAANSSLQMIPHK